MYVLLKSLDGQMIVRTVDYWEKYMHDIPGHPWKYVTNHTSSSALLKMIELAMDDKPDDEKKRQARADNSPEHVNKKTIIHWTPNNVRGQT